MGSKSEESVGSSGQGRNSGLALPQLTGAIDFASWRLRFNVFLQHHGLGSVLEKQWLEADFIQVREKVAEWAKETEDAMMALALQPASASASAPAAKPLPAELATARKFATDKYERSVRAFGYICSALPEKLRVQTISVVEGHAYGLWQWLQSKFQSTETDAIDGLLGAWQALMQEIEESADAFRARVDTMRQLLDAADEPVSERMLQHKLLSGLRSEYKIIMLTIKASHALDANKIHSRERKKLEAAGKTVPQVNWDDIWKQINAFERDLQRTAEKDASESAMSMRGDSRAAYGRESERRGGGASSGAGAGGPRMKRLDK